jgi:hypothetical protein
MQEKHPRFLPWVHEAPANKSGCFFLVLSLDQKPVEPLFNANHIKQDHTQISRNQRKQ